MTLRDQLMQDEGLRLMPYRDSVGLLTIGYGRCLDRKGISRAEAESMLDHDITDAEVGLAAVAPWAAGLDEVRRAVMVNMTLNLGAAGLMGFHRMLAALKEHRYEIAAREMLASKWAGQVGDRAIRLARQMRTGEWPKVS